MSAIVFSNVCKSFKTNLETKKVLDSLNLEIGSGGIYGLAGINGAGKTTAIKVLLGLCSSDSGEAIFEGYRAGNVPSNTIGFAPENAALPGFLNAKKLLKLSCELIGIKSDHDEIRTTLSRFNIDPDKPIANMSKGMMQRVSLATATFHKPKFLILDEPSSGLDPTGRELVRSVVCELNKEGTTVLLSTHILSDLEDFCTCFAIINGGKAVFSGTAKELFDVSKTNNITEAFNNQINKV